MKIPGLPPMVSGNGRLMRRNKFGVAAASERLYNGVLYHSKLEKNHAVLLDTLRTAQAPQDRVVAWDRQIPFPIEVNGVHVCKYIVDFRVEYADGRIDYVEVKGMDTEVGIIKMRLFKALYPDKVLRVVR